MSASEARSEGAARAESATASEARSEGAARAESATASEARSEGAARAESATASEARSEGAARAESATKAGERVGILGGTFNPIHRGHIHAAEQVLGKLGLARVVFVPAADPPLKRGGAGPIAPAALRLAWVELAVQGRAVFSVDDLELRRSGPSYTVDTLRALTAKLAPARLVFLIGEDAFAELDAWREPAALLSLADFAVMTRPPGLGRPLRSLLSKPLAAQLDWASDGESATQRSAKTSIARVAIEALDVSATEVRRRIRAGESVRYLLPEAVHDAVIASGAYAAR
jgi:nicotinate-nucleotide adenylyltransferase